MLMMRGVFSLFTVFSPFTVQLHTSISLIISSIEGQKKLQKTPKTYTLTDSKKKPTAMQIACSTVGLVIMTLELTQ